MANPPNSARSTHSSAVNPRADDLLLQRLKRYFTEAEQLTSEGRANSLKALDYYDSDQFSAHERATLEARGQPTVVINRIKPAINGVIGVIENGRSDPRCWPRNPDDTDAADAATDVLRYIAEQNRFARLKQDCFRDLLVPGTMAALVGVDADSQVTVTQVRWEEFFHDPRSRRPDFKDARYLGLAKWMYQDDAEALYPEKAREIGLAARGGLGDGAISAPSYLDRPMNGPPLPGCWFDSSLGRLLVVELYHKEAGRWMRSLFTGSDLLEQGPSPYLDHKGRPDCPIEAQSAYVKRDNTRYGAVWDMIDPQNEINRRRSKSLHLLTVSRIEARDSVAMDVDVEVARHEAARPDGVLPFGFALSPNTAEFQGNLQMLQEAKAEIERMGPTPALLGRNPHDDSGRALLARQQSGLSELAHLYGALEDWELRLYRQMWARAKQHWTAPQFIRVTDDENAPRFVGLNQPIPGGPPTLEADPGTGTPTLRPGILGYRNRVAEMDVDIELDTQPANATVQQEAFNDLMRLVGASGLYQQQIPLSLLIQLSPIPHKRAILDQIKQASDAQSQQAAVQAQLGQAMAEARLGEVRARTAELKAKAPLHAATGFAKSLDALTYARDSRRPGAPAPPLTSDGAQQADEPIV